MSCRAWLMTAAIASLAMAATPALAEETARAAGPRLYITGRATLEAPPDYASVSIGVATKSPTTAAAIDGTSASAARIIAAAKSAGIAPRDIQTGTLSLEPVYRTVRDPAGGSEQRPDGYQATNSVTVRIRDIGRLGEVLRLVVDGGANRIDGVSFELAEPGKLELKALEAAVLDARRQAEVIAAAAGVRLARIEEIRSGERAERPMPMSRARRAVAPSPAPVPVEAGSLDVTSEVQVVFALEQP